MLIPCPQCVSDKTFKTKSSETFPNLFRHFSRLRSGDSEFYTRGILTEITAPVKGLDVT